MFGLPSIQKLIVLAAVVAAVWYGFKFLGRLQETRKAEARLREGKGGKPAPKSGAKSASEGAGQAGDAADAVEDLVQCPSCGAYIQAGTKCNCGRKS